MFNTPYVDRFRRKKKVSKIMTDRKAKDATDYAFINVLHYCMLVRDECIVLLDDTCRVTFWWYCIHEATITILFGGTVCIHEATITR